jgi:hypothetical protein
VQVVVAVVQVTPGGVEVTVYPLMSDPPLALADQDTVAWGYELLAMPDTFEATTPAGVDGTVATATLFDAVEDVPVPAALLAVTLKV